MDGQATTNAPASKAAGGKARRGRRLGLFLRSSAFDYLLVLAVCGALAFTVTYGFNSAPGLRSNAVLVTGICAVLLIPLYLGGLSKRAVGAAAAAYIALTVVLVAVLLAASPDPVLFADGQINDSEGNYAVFGMVVAAVVVVVFLLSRRTWGLVVLLVVAAVLCGAIQFLYRDWTESQPGTAAALVAYAGIGALFVVQGYRRSVLSAQRVRKVSFGSSFVFGIAASAVCVALACGLFFGIVAGLGIQTVNFKPFQDYYQRPVVEYDGTFQQQAVISDDEATSNISDEMQSTSSDAQGQDSQDQDSESGGGYATVQSIIDTLNPDSFTSQLEAVRTDMPTSLKFLLALIPIALVALVIWMRYHRRTARLKKIAGQSFAWQAAYLYDFFMDRFKRLKIDKAASATPMAFAVSSVDELAPFSRNASRTNFLDVTLIYQRAAYGAGDVDAADVKRMRDFYEAFFAHARGRMNLLKWAFWGFWRI